MVTSIGSRGEPKLTRTPNKWGVMGGRHGVDNAELAIKAPQGDMNFMRAEIWKGIP